MSIGLPVPVPDIVYRLITSSRFLSYAVEKAYRAYVRVYLRIRTYFQVGRHHQAPIDPLEIIWIPPESIKYVHESRRGDDFLPEVVGGNWDQNLPHFNDQTIYESFRLHFEEGVPWAETDYVEEMIQETGGKFDRFDSPETAIERLQQYDRLYEAIQKGYRPQFELDKDDDLIDDLVELRYYPPELREITVDIGRDGEFIWFWGQHRLAIAKILDIDMIPVRIRWRHEKWQTKRDEAIGRISDHKAIQTNHPDLP